MSKKLELEIHVLSHRIATMQVGETKETDSLRIVYKARDLYVWDLTNAGKRGKQVSRFSIDTDRKGVGAANDLIDQIEGKNYHEALTLAKKWAQENDLSVYEAEEKGINVTPAGFKPISVQGKEVFVNADYNTFSVRDRSNINEETCIPAIKGGKADIKVFYRWVKDNEEKIKTMDFNQVVKGMSDAGIRYHYYCALD